jgi:ubiquinone/menaquinone biosynthesis C-methylase UbiE
VTPARPSAQRGADAGPDGRQASLGPGEPAHVLKDLNIRYHDAAAESYDSKWGIDYGDVGRRQVLMKLTKALGSAPGHYARALEIGAGTGYFSLNLLQTGVIAEATATDISAGMLEQLAVTAGRLGLDVRTVRTDAEQLPFEDGSFDLVLGHAVLHHLPRLAPALAEFERVLAPSGTLAFMGEPSRRGDRLAVLPKRVGTLARPAWRRLFGVQGEADGDGAAANARAGEDHDLEPWVDIHVFDPVQLRALAAAAGFVDVRVGGEELLASAYGWMLRSLQAGTDPKRVSPLWHQFAYRSYLALQWLDGRALEPRLPAGLFYNLLLSARKRADI